MKNFVKTLAVAAVLASGYGLPAVSQPVTRQCGVIVFFPSGQNALGPNARAAVEAFAAANPGASFSVTGYTDAAGSAAANQTLSQRRAASVASALSATNVTSVVGAGEAVRPGTSGPEDGTNRRVEIVNENCPGGLYASQPATPGDPFSGVAVAAGIGGLAILAALINNDSAGGSSGGS